jgi:hypothetical protein
MRADTRFATPATDPAAPSPEVTMMEDLHSVLIAPQNLPFLCPHGCAWIQRRPFMPRWINSSLRQ